MRHSAVSEPPRERRDYRKRSELFVRAERRLERLAEIARDCLRVEIPHRLDCVGRPAERDDRDCRRDDERHENERSLHEIGRADGSVSARNRVAEDDDKPDCKPRVVRKTENRVEQLRARDESRRGVNREEEHDEDNRDDGNDVRFVLEPVREEFRNRNRIPERNRAFSERLRDDKPVHVRSDDKTHRRPERFPDSAHVAQSGQSHQKPRRRIGRLRRQRRDPGTDFAPADEEIRRAVVLAGVPEPDVNHESEIQDERQNLCDHC